MLSVLLEKYPSFIKGPDKVQNRMGGNLHEELPTLLVHINHVNRDIIQEVFHESSAGLSVHLPQSPQTNDKQVRDKQGLIC